MLTITTHSLAQTIDPPDYLKLLLNDLMRGDENAFTVAFERVSERSERQLYSERDTYYIVLALHQRARASEELRPQIITLLGQIGAKESVYELTEWARTGTRDVRLSALQALGWIGDPAANDALLRLENIGDDEQMVFMREYALKAIGVKERIRSLAHAKNARPDAWYEIIHETLLTEPNWLVRADIARMLETWNDKRVWLLLFDAHSHWQGPEQYHAQIQRVMAKRYLFDNRYFCGTLRTRDSASKIFGLESIADYALPADLAALMELAETDSDARVREHAARVLGNLLNR